MFVEDPVELVEGDCPGVLGGNPADQRFAGVDVDPVDCVHGVYVDAHYLWVENESHSARIDRSCTRAIYIVLDKLVSLNASTVD